MHGAANAQLKDFDTSSNEAAVALASEWPLLPPLSPRPLRMLALVPELVLVLMLAPLPRQQPHRSLQLPMAPAPWVPRL